jgi:hypothetical protein
VRVGLSGDRDIVRVIWQVEDQMQTGVIAEI